MQQKIVITGGPSTGKTTVINELERRGYHCIEEISRQVTKKAQEDGIEQLFLEDPLLFSKLLLKGREKQFKKVDKSKNELVFFDRGIPDVHAYMNYLGVDYPDIYIKKSKKYEYDLIFLMPPWEEIYTTDKERYESFEQSLAIYNHLRNAYENIGYQVVEIPIGSIDQRIDFILATIKNSS